MTNKTKKKGYKKIETLLLNMQVPTASKVCCMSALGMNITNLPNYRVPTVCMYNTSAMRIRMRSLLNEQIAHRLSTYTIVVEYMFSYRSCFERLLSTV